MACKWYISIVTHWKKEFDETCRLTFVIKYKDKDLQEMNHGAALDSSKPIKILTYYQYKKSLMILKG